MSPEDEDPAFEPIFRSVLRWEDVEAAAKYARLARLLRPSPVPVDEPDECVEGS